MSHPSAARFTISRVEDGGVRSVEDLVAVEEPLEIRLGYEVGGERAARSISVTMRTPGEDLDLAVGFLFTEGIIKGCEDVDSVRHCGPKVEGRNTSNVVRVELKDGVPVDIARLSRHFYTTSSCGVCGKTSLDAVAAQGLQPLTAGPTVQAELLWSLPERLGRAQTAFQQTGGIHGAALFDTSGSMLCLREDIGRHNAVDKVIGSLAMGGDLGKSSILLVSGRGGFELVQKALVARIPIFGAVGAPSSLAVELAKAHGMTLIGFLKQGRFNVYSAPERLHSPAVSTQTPI